MKKIRAAVVGYGNIGHYAIEALEAAKDFEIAGIVRRQGDKDKPLELTPYDVVDDIAKLKEKLDKWGRPMVLLFTSEAEKKKFEAQKSEFGSLPEKTIFGIDRNGIIQKEIAREMKLRNANQLPIFIIADTFNRVVFISQGYTIGLGEQLVKTGSKL